MFHREFTARSLLLLFTVFLCSIGNTLCGQIMVGLTGSDAQTFDSLPPTNTWSTLNTFGTSAAYSGTNAAAAMDAGVQRFAASNINEGLLSTSQNTGGSPRARWNSIAHCLQTQVDGGIDAVMLLGTLTNVSGIPIVGFALQFDFAIPGAPGPEDIAGHRLYFNVSGSTSNWVPIGTVSNAGPQSIRLSFADSAWAPGTAMYLLFMDDNAVTNPEGSYQIDNLVITNVLSRLNISRDGNTGEITVSWQAEAMLQEATDFAGPDTVWFDVPGVGNEFRFVPAGDRRFFRLKP